MAEAQTSEAERECLARHAQGKKCLAEIGVWHGMTTCRLRRAMAAEGMLVAVDPYPPGKLGFSAQQIIAHREVSRIRHGTVNWLRTTGCEAARNLPATIRRAFDFVFVDGNHSYEGLRGDWEGWAKLVAPGGIIALHDSRSSSGRRIDDLGSVRFTRDVIVRDTRFRVIETVDSLTVLRRQ
jgi:predicted O-methyltransferase YrrM